MTEEEAKTKWCPRYQVATSGGDSSTYEMDNRPMEYEQGVDEKWHPTERINPAACCFGSACMAWRWITNHDLKPFDVHTSALSNWKGYKVLSEPDENNMVTIQSPKPKEGYCGAAGPLHPG